MKTIINRIKNKYIRLNLFEYLSITKLFKIIKYNKKLLSEIDINKKEIKIYLLLDRIIKPISNCEDYLPIIKRIYSHYNNTTNHINTLDNIQASNLFCQYMNKTIPFVPQINNINDNEEILKSINYFKIGFNQIFLDNFYDNENKFVFNRLFEFCNKYGHKIVEITFIDNNIININAKKENLFIMKYIIKNSNIQKIEDRKFDILDKSLFLKIFDLDNNEDAYEKKYSYLIKKGKDQKNIMDIIKEIKYYSLDFGYNYINNIIKSFNNDILLNAKQLKEIKITNIDKENSSNFINLLKDLNKLDSLSIENLSDNYSLFDEISKVIKDNSLKKLEMNLYYFEEGINIINKNSNSLKELTLKLNNMSNNKFQLFKVLSNLANLLKLRIISDFKIIKEKDINYLSFKKLKYLEMPLNISKPIFDFNKFFEKNPNIEILKLYRIQFYKNNTLNNNNDIKLNGKFIQKLRKIKFYNCHKSSTFFIIKLLKLLSNTNIKDNISEIKIENCEFDKEIGINDLFKEISAFKNITNLQLNNINFSQGQNFFYDKMDNFKYLQKFYFKGLDSEQNLIHTLSFLSYLEEKCKYIADIGLSCKNLNSDDINLILRKLQIFKFISKVNIFDNYSKKDNYSYRNKNYLGIIDLDGIYDYFMVDLRSLNLRKEFKYNNTISYLYPKIYINDYYYHLKDNIFAKKNEKYYSYQNLFNKNSKIKILYYSNLENIFTLNEIMHNP